MSLTRLFWSYWTVCHMIFICLLLWGVFFVCFFGAGGYISDSCSNLGSPGNWNMAKKAFSLQVSTQPPSLWTYNDLSPNRFSHQISIFKSLSLCCLHFYHHWYHFIIGLPSTHYYFDFLISHQYILYQHEQEISLSQHNLASLSNFEMLKIWDHVTFMFIYISSF